MRRHQATMVVSLAACMMAAGMTWSTGASCAALKAAIDVDALMDFVAFVVQLS